MRIRKKEPSVGILGKIVNSFTNSKNDTYSADYLNKTLDEKVNSRDVYTKTEVDTKLSKVKDIVTGTLTPQNGTTITLDNFILLEGMLILTANIVATKDVPQYSGIAKLSGAPLPLAGNVYIWDKWDTECYIDKNHGVLAIYKNGGLKKGEVVCIQGTFILDR